MDIVSAKYDLICSNKLAHSHIVDFRPYVAKLYEYAVLSDSIVEIGVRSGVSTWVLLAGRPKRLISIDIRVCQVGEHIAAAKEAGIDFQFIISDSLLWTPLDKSDMLFVDGKHTFSHVLQELRQYAPYIKKYILLHDTVSYGGTKKQPGLRKAIDDFLAENKEWCFVESVDTRLGMTVLKRISGVA